MLTAALLVCLIGILPGCGKDSTGNHRTIRVPLDRPTISAAVKAARQGDLVMISPGTYHETVLVRTPGIVIRGADRNTVILDGGYKLENGFVVNADGVAIENLTTRAYNGNGVFFSKAYTESGVDPSITYGAGDAVVKGFRISYVTSYNNGLYGIYAFASRGGRIDHSLASGNPDSGIYVGQCKPCNVVLTDDITETNAIGYYGTNASGGVYVINSIFRSNRIGLTPNSQKMEKLAPQSETVVAGNLVIDNANPNAPDVPRGSIGLGIAIGGGTRNTVVKNKVTGNPVAGIIITDLDDYQPENNRVEANMLSGNGIDLVYKPSGAAASGPPGAGNCFAGNTFTSSIPATIESALPCRSTPAPIGASGALPSVAAPKGPSYKNIPAPAPQPSMPDAATALAAPAIDIVPAIDLATIAVPA